MFFSTPDLSLSLPLSFSSSSDFLSFSKKKKKKKKFKIKTSDVFFISWSVDRYRSADRYRGRARYSGPLCGKINGPEKVRKNRAVDRYRAVDRCRGRAPYGVLRYRGRAPYGVLHKQKKHFSPRPHAHSHAFRHIRTLTHMTVSTHAYFYSFHTSWRKKKTQKREKIQFMHYAWKKINVKQAST